MSERWWKRRWFRHYLPLVYVLLLLPFPWMASFIGAPAAASTAVASAPTCRPNVPADIAFALMGFWLWAYTTNAHSGCFVRSSGATKISRANADQDKKKEEVERTILFATLTAMAYFASVIPALRWAGGLGVFVALLFPILILRMPD